MIRYQIPLKLSQCRSAKNQFACGSSGINGRLMTSQNLEPYSSPRQVVNRVYQVM
ncbi:hypothetical protein ABIC12_004711 [Pantoea agglomerans]|jgi:hypothetical protein|nr:hypothetical protein [Pantoea agglomerans]